MTSQNIQFYCHGENGSCKALVSLVPPPSPPMKLN